MSWFRASEHQPRRRSATWLAVLLLAATAPATRALEQTLTGDNVKATFWIPGSSLPTHGFVPVRVTVENRLDRELQWQLSTQDSGHDHSATVLAKMATTLTFPAARTTERWFFAPISFGTLHAPGTYYGQRMGFTVMVSGPGIRDGSVHFGPSVWGSSPSIPALAVSPALEKIVTDVLTERAGQSIATSPGRRPRPSPARGSIGSNIAAVDFSQPLPDWRMWAPFGAAILTEADYNAMPAGNRAALRNWIALGGALYLSPSSATPKNAEWWGAGVVRKLHWPLNDPTNAAWDLPRVDSDSALPMSISLSQQKTTMADAIASAPKAGDWLVYFFIGFAVLVAPVNLYAIAPARRRQWLFFTVPAISLLAVGVLATAIFFQDGTGGEGVRRALVVLLPGDNQAAVFQEQVSRTGMLFDTSFPLADDTLCIAAAAEDPNVNAGRQLTYERENGRAAGDWFRSRARQAQHLRRLTPTRARVELVGTAPGGAPIVQSSVGTTLREFRYVDKGGVAWQADEVPAGARVTLKRAANFAGLTTTLTQYSRGGSVHLHHIATRVMSAGEPGRFVARTETFDLAPLPTLASIRWKESEVMIIGTVEPGGKAAR